MGREESFNPSTARKVLDQYKADPEEKDRERYQEKLQHVEKILLENPDVVTHTFHLPIGRYAFLPLDNSPYAKS